MPFNYLPRQKRLAEILDRNTWQKNLRERAGTVGWARTTDLLFHRQNKGTDEATLFPPIVRKLQYYQILTSSNLALPALQLALWW